MNSRREGQKAGEKTTSTFDFKKRIPSKKKKERRNNPI